MVDIDAIRRIARRRVYWSDRWEDVAQTACLLALKRQSTPWCHVVDAIRLEFGRDRNPRTAAILRAAPLEHPEWIAGRYATAAELGERWIDEENEDLFDEWRKLPAADRAQRVRESGIALGCSDVED